MLFVSFPFFVDAAKEGFKQVDPRFENVARSLGASQLRTFFEVSFPLASPSIISGAIMCWGRAISEFSAVLVLASFPEECTYSDLRAFHILRLESSDARRCPFNLNLPAYFRASAFARHKSGQFKEIEKGGGGLSD